MAAREILQLGTPLLWERSAEVTDLGSKDTHTLLRDLEDTLTDFYETHGFGRAIAAPQIGVLQRVIFIHMRPTGLHGPLINPEITWADQRQRELWDDCFSFPDLLVKVRRAEQIRVKYLDKEGQERRVHAEGDLSELLQHEIDHLDGILAVQRAISPQAFSTRNAWLRWHRKG